MESTIVREPGPQCSDDGVIRPQTLSEYSGQTVVREQMEIFLGAARSRGEALDHTLIFGPPGLGKTTLANIIANEMGANIKTTSGPVLEKAGDLASILTTIEAGDIIFIDEIHRLNTSVEEILYPAMEDFKMDIMIGDGPDARCINLEVPPFTLVGATTRAGLLSAPLRDRFGITQRLEFYDREELSKIVIRAGRISGVNITKEGAYEIADRARGTPRIANRLLRRVRDFAEVRNNGVADQSTTKKALDMLNIDEFGLDHMDQRLLRAMINSFDGRPVGVESLSAAIGEERGTIEDVIEPYLIQNGYLMRTPRGRQVTDKAYKHLESKEQ